MGGFRSRSESARSGEGQRKKATGYQQRRPEHRQRKSRSRGSGDKVRDVVFGVLRDVTVDGAFGNLALPKALRESGIKGRDAAFATELAYGTLRARGLLDAIIEDAAGRKIEKIDSVALDALRLGDQDRAELLMRAHGLRSLRQASQHPAPPQAVPTLNEDGMADGLAPAGPDGSSQNGPDHNRRTT